MISRFVGYIKTCQEMECALLLFRFDWLIMHMMPKTNNTPIALIHKYPGHIHRRRDPFFLPTRMLCFQSCLSICHIWSPSMMHWTDHFPRCLEMGIIHPTPRKWGILNTFEHVWVGSLYIPRIESWVMSISVLATCVWHVSHLSATC